MGRTDIPWPTASDPQTHPTAMQEPDTTCSTGGKAPPQTFPQLLLGCAAGLENLHKGKATHWALRFPATPAHQDPEHPCQACSTHFCQAKGHLVPPLPPHQMCCLAQDHTQYGPGSAAPALVLCPTALPLIRSLHRARHTGGTWFPLSHRCRKMLSLVARSNHLTSAVMPQ